MTQMTVSLPDELKAFIDKQVADKGYESVSEYLRDLVRVQRDKDQLRQLLLDGAVSPVVGDFDTKYFTDLRNKIKSGSR